MTLSVNGASNALAALQALAASNAAVGGTRANGGANAASGVASPVQAPAAAPATISALHAAGQAIGRAVSTADAAGAAGRTVIGHLQVMHDAAQTAADPQTTSAERAALDATFQDGAAHIAPSLAAATLEGVNLVDGSLKAPMQVALGGGQASLSPQDLTLGGPTLKLGALGSIATPEDAASAATAVGDAIGAVGQALSTLDGQARQIDVHGGFVQALGRALSAPSTSDGGDSVRLLALQVQQQLAATSGAIANQSPAAVLALMRS